MYAPAFPAALRSFLCLVRRADAMRVFVYVAGTVAGAARHDNNKQPRARLRCCADSTTAGIVAPPLRNARSGPPGLRTCSRSAGWCTDTVKRSIGSKSTNTHPRSLAAPLASSSPLLPLKPAQPTESLQFLIRHRRWPS